MNYSFDKFERAINSLFAVAENRPVCQPPEMENNIQVFFDEKERIRLQIIEEVFAMKEQGSLELLIDKYQAVLLRLLDQLYTYEKVTRKNVINKEFSTALYSQLFELLCFLNIHYSKFFNHECRIPMLEMEKFKKQFNPKIEVLKTKSNMSGNSDQLVSQVIDTLKTFMSDEHITYRTYGYLKQAIRDLETFDFEQEQDSLQSNFRSVLVTINFNCTQVREYIISNWINNLNGEDSISERLRILKFNLKEVKQLIEKPGYILYTGHPSLKDQLVNWLTEETQYYQAEQSIVIPLQNAAESDAKIHTSMSVPQLALLFRLLKEDHQITNSNQSEFLKVVSDCLQV